MRYCHSDMNSQQLCLPAPNLHKIKHERGKGATALTPKGLVTVDTLVGGEVNFLVAQPLYSIEYPYTHQYRDSIYNKNGDIMFWELHTSLDKSMNPCLKIKQVKRVSGL